MCYDDYEEELTPEGETKLHLDLLNLRFASLRDMIAKDNCLPTCAIIPGSENNLTQERYTAQCKQELSKYDALLAKLGKDRFEIEDMDKIEEILKGK